jgi:hypothetical protein
MGVVEVASAVLALTVGCIMRVYWVKVASVVALLVMAGARAMFKLWERCRCVLLS